MDTTLKQRILGIIVLMALIGICLTVLLHNDKSPQRKDDETITVQPQIATSNAALLTTNNTTQPPVNTSALSTIPAPTPTPQPNNNVFNQTTPAPTPAAVIAKPTPAPAIATTPVTQAVTPAAKPADLYTLPDNNINNAPAASAPKNIPTTSKVATIANSNFANPQTTTNVTTPTTTQSSTSATKAPQHKVAVTLPASAVTHKKASTVSDNGETDLVVQVGSFTLPANAETLVDKLHAKGFTATAQKMQTAKGEMTRVIVGKKGLNHTQADALRTKLQSSMQIQGFIVSHDPATTTKTSKKAVKQTSKNTNNDVSINDDI